jgi:hypothetical protein
MSKENFELDQAYKRFFAKIVLKLENQQQRLKNSNSYDKNKKETESLIKYIKIVILILDGISKDSKNNELTEIKKLIIILNKLIKMIEDMKELENKDIIKISSNIESILKRGIGVF